MLIDEQFRRHVLNMLACLPTALVVFEGALVVPSLYEALGPIVEHALADEDTPHVLTLFGFVNVAHGFGGLMQTQMVLGAGQMVVGIPYVAVVWVVLAFPLFFCHLLEKHSPLLSDVLHALPAFLFVEGIAVVRVDIVERRGVDVACADMLQALLIAVDGLVEIAHIEIGVAHGIVSQCQSVTVVALGGVGMHLLHLLQGGVYLAHEGVGVDEVHPCLVVVIPALLSLVEGQVEGRLLYERVVFVIVVEFAQVVDATRTFLSVGVVGTDSNGHQ